MILVSHSMNEHAFENPTSLAHIARRDEGDTSFWYENAASWNTARVLHELDVEPAV